MAKYIEIDTAIETALLLLEEGEDEQTLAYNAALVAFVKNMEKQPAADVEEVVRCCDCIYHTGDDECTNGRWDNWTNSEYEIYPEALEMDYCSYGVRKNG